MALKLLITYFWFQLDRFPLFFKGIGLNSFRMLKYKLLYALIFSFCCTTSSLLGQIVVKADNSTAMYSVGEEMKFIITSNVNGQAEYKIGYDRFTDPIDSGQITLNSSQPAEIPFVLNEPGVVYCWISINNQHSFGGASFDPFLIKTTQDDPADLLTFWENEKAALANIPVDPQVTFLSSGNYADNYRVNLGFIDNRRVYGYLSVPNVGGPFPVALELPPFGAAPNVADLDEIVAERIGVLAMSISIHNAEPDEVDPNAYFPQEINNKDSIYFRYGILAGIRAIDYLTSRADYDGENVVVMGVSQGGGLSMLVAGLDDRVKLLAVSNAALCEHTAYAEGRASGFPYFLQESENEVGTSNHFNQTLDASKYYDAARIVKLYNGPSLSIIGYRDTICPAASTYAAFNALSGPKVLLHSTILEHTHPDEYFNGRFDYFRRYFPSTSNPPWPWPDTTTGYVIDAGIDLSNILINQSIPLNGSFEFNGDTNTNLPIKWSLQSGPQVVTFSDPNSLSTDVVFYEEGNYVLQLLVEDDYPQDDNEFYSIVDLISVEVINPISTQNLVEEDSNFAVSPNPSEGVYFIEFKSPIESNGILLVYDSGGTIIKTIPSNTGTTNLKVDLELFPAGVYYFEHKIGNQSELLKVIKN